MSRIYQVGDEAELSPPLMSRFLSELVEQGGRAVIKGNRAVVVYAPQAEAPKPQPKPDPVPALRSEPIVVEEEKEETPKKKSAPRKRTVSKAVDE